MKVIAKIDVYKINDIETELEDRPAICLESCGLYSPPIFLASRGRYSPRVVVVVDGRRVEIDADDLLKAVKRVKGV